MLVKKYRRLLVMFLMMYLGHSISGQNADPVSYFVELEAADSIWFDTINGYYDVNVFVLPDTVVRLAGYHLDRAEAKGNLGEMVNALKSRSMAYCLIGDQKSGLADMELAAGWAKELGDFETLNKIYNNMGSAYYSQRQHVEAFKYYNLSLPYFKENKKYHAVGNIVNNIGLIFSQLKNYDKSLAYMNEALTWYGKVPEYVNDGLIWNNFANVLLKQEKYDESISYLDKAMAIYETNDNIRFRAEAYLLYSQAYEGLGQNDKALNYVNKGIALSEEYNFRYQLFFNKITLSSLLIEKDLDRATQIAEDLLKDKYNPEIKSAKKELYLLLSQCYKAQDKPELALEMLEVHKVYSDSLEVEDQKDNFVTLAIQKEYEDQLIQSENNFEKEKSQLKESQTKQTIAIILGCLVLILGGGFFAMSRNKKHKKTESKLLEEIEMLKLELENQSPLQTEGFALNRDNLETKIGRNINDTDWTVLNILLEDPVITNKAIAEKAFLSVDGIGSSLRRMYQMFEIKESRYMKISLLMDAMKLSK